MHNTRAGWYDQQVLEGLGSPLQEPKAFLVAVELLLEVEPQRVRTNNEEETLN